MNEPFVIDCIRRIRKSYGYLTEIPPVIIEEINSLYPVMSGCSFLDWLNHRLYTEIIVNSDKIMPYMDFEDLEEDEKENPIMTTCIRCACNMEIITLTERNREWSIGEGAYVCDKCQDDYEEYCFQEHLKDMN